MSHAEAMPDLVREFCKVTRLPHDPFAKEFLNRCRSHTIKVNGRFYKFFQSGKGPTVLLVHGVNANLGSMVTMADELLGQGYRVVLFDVAGHGEALGAAAVDPGEIRDLLRGIYDRIADLHAVICHSMGGLWALSAWHGELNAKALVSISSPASMMFLVEKFAELHALEGDQVQELIGQIGNCFGKDVWATYSPAEVVKTINVPGLIIHGAADAYVPPAHAKDLHAGWPQANMELIEGAGHFDIMESLQVRSLVSAYLREAR
ncbi:alpha/beta fold hydrolase [Streptomyces zagrosensis]|uniref:Pimeloyl-ACP methyl ester carboxylesterase n=1 Tax=Streptomyces zagrosensis TaxID=1042984 RepID=A0A7W9QH27_9ACTN|nr:alpha/beta fold hydrolase [Streptomyces zagrosensis]MBB5939894.1 pimeloyl-ACP methyl ester carboxylesterase [Streptomyces zagrosensis]